MKTKIVSKNLVVRNPVKAAVRLSRRASTQEIENASLEHKKAVEVLAQINQLQSNLLPIEKGMINTISSKKSEALKRVKQFESLNKLNRYAVFSLEPLAWRDKQGFPRLAVFSLESPNFEITIKGSYDDYGRRWRRVLEPKLPKDMKECYDDVFRKLSKIAKQARKTTSLRTQFTMLIPQAAKKEIARARKEFKEIFVVAEAPCWDLKQVAIPKPKPKPDPLVVGYDGINYWLITAFDLTSLENYIKAEFCVKET